VNKKEEGEVMREKALALLFALCILLPFGSSLLTSASNCASDDPLVKACAWKNCQTHGFSSRDSGWKSGNPASALAGPISCGSVSPPHATFAFQYIWALKTSSGKIIMPIGCCLALGSGCSAGKSYWVQGFPEEKIEVDFSRGIILNQTLNSFAVIELKVSDLNTSQILFYANASVSPEGFKVSGPPDWSEAWSYNLIEAVTGIEARFGPKNITISVPEGDVIEVFCNATAASYEDNAEAAVQIEQEWVPYIPAEENVELRHWVANGVSHVNVSITFPHTEFNVSDWGTPIMVGNSISVDAQIWEWTGPTMPVVTIKQHTYELGFLSPGEYNFTFMVWGQIIKSLKFEIVRDIAIVNVWPKKNIVPQGLSFEYDAPWLPAPIPPRKTLGLIIVNVTNKGDFTEIFNLTVYEGLEPAPIYIERWPDPDGNISDMFWRRGDANRDGYVDYYDVCVVKHFYGWTGPPGKNPADVTCDGIVDTRDLMLISMNFNLTIWDHFHLSKIFQDYAVVRLNSTDYKFIGFRWNTTETSFGNYTFSAYAWLVPEETNTENNAFKDGWIYVAGVGDINVDEIVDIFDVVLVALAFGSSPPDPNYNPNADINDDCIIDIFDITIIAIYFGRTYQYP
jgi:hypothetical protein